MHIQIPVNRIIKINIYNIRKCGHITSNLTRWNYARLHEIEPAVCQFVEIIYPVCLYIHYNNLIFNEIVIIIVTN